MKLRNDCILLKIFTLLLLLNTNCSREDLTNEKNSELAYNEMSEKGFLNLNTFSEFDKNISRTKKLINFGQSTINNSNTNKTTNNISISAKKGNLKNVTIIMYVPKDVASNVKDIEYSINPTEIINEDPITIWHLDDLNEDSFSLKSLFKGKHNLKGSLIVLSENEYEIDTGRLFSIYGITRKKYNDDSDWDQIVKDVFGANYRVLDWNDLIKLRDDKSLKIVLDNLGLKDFGDSGYVTKNGNRNYSNSRYYFISRHNKDKPSN